MVEQVGGLCLWVRYVLFGKKKNKTQKHKKNALEDKQPRDTFFCLVADPISFNTIYWVADFQFKAIKTVLR